MLLKTIRHFGGAALLTVCFGLLIMLPQTAAAAMREGLTLCGTVILPSLFPFFVCSQLFVLLGFSARVSTRLAKPSARLLRLPAPAASAFLAGLAGGYPAGAQLIGSIYESGALGREDAERALAVCNQAGPSFIFGVLGGSVFKSPALGACLYLIQLLSALLVCRLTGSRSSFPAGMSAARQPAMSFAAAFSQAVRRAGMSAIQICMYVCVFCVLCRYLQLAVGAYLPPALAPLLLGTLELSGGCAALSGCPLPLTAKLCLASALLSFGGLCVHAQIRAVTADSGLRGTRLLPVKLLQAGVSFLLCLFFCAIFRPQHWQVPATAGSQIPIAQLSLLMSSTLCLIFRKLHSSISAEHRVY